MADSKAQRALRRRARRIDTLLAELYPDAHCALTFANPLQLLIATILSAQCTDVRVNQVTPALFERFRGAQDFADAEPAEVERLIRTAGFFRNKARNIIACCRMLVEKHEGTVPRTMEELVLLPGVGRKTANVILGNAFDTPGLPVDTHVGRLSQRMGLTVHTDPVKIEADLNALIPKEDWTDFGHRMIFHGRQVCHARKPDCPNCPLREVCPKLGTTFAAEAREIE
jgi:endonuclease-3